MTKEMIIEILVADGCTKKEAENFIKTGTVIYSDADVSELLADYENSFTVQDIKDGKVADIRHVVYQSENYYIEYVL